MYRVLQFPVMLLFLFLLASAGPACAQFAPEEMMHPFAFTNAAGSVFLARLSAPQYPVAGRKYPLILFLHGSGECGTDNLKQIQVGLPALLKMLINRPEPVMVLAPQCSQTNAWIQQLVMPEYTASKEATRALSGAVEMCRHLIATRQADPDRIYITGLSLGGFGTWDAIQRHPDLFAAALPICGAGDLRRTQEIRRLPIWVFHGREDKSVPVACSRQIVRQLDAIGARNIRYTEYKDGGHVIWNQVYSDTQVITWLLAQTRARKAWWKLW